MKYNHDENPYRILDGLEASARRVINSLINSFDEDSSDVTLLPVMASNKINKCICSGDFPPSNIYIKDGVYSMDFACAGYCEDDITMSYEDNYITISFKGTQMDMTRVIPIKKGIRNTDTTVKVFVDSQKYDVSKISASLKNGILHVSVGPNKEHVKAYSIGINGNAPKKMIADDSKEKGEVEEKGESKEEKKCE